MMGATRHLNQKPMRVQYRPSDDMVPDHISDDERVKIQRMLDVMRYFPDGIPVRNLFAIVGYTHTAKNIEKILGKLEHFTLIWADDGKIGLVE